MAGTLIETFGRIRSMYLADDSALLELGMTPRQVRLLRAAIDLGTRASSDTLPLGTVVKQAADVAEHFSQRLALVQIEEFWALALDVRNRIVKELLLGRGSLTSVDVHPRDVFRQLVRAGAATAIFVHNHPSGDPLPSEQDLELTDRLVAAGQLMGIPVLDHLVVAAGGAYTSLLYAARRPPDASPRDLSFEQRALMQATLSVLEDDKRRWLRGRKAPR